MYDVFGIKTKLFKSLISKGIKKGIKKSLDIDVDVDVKDFVLFFDEDSGVGTVNINVGANFNKEDISKLLKLI